MMTIVITRNVPGRFRGFLASCMLEIDPACYISKSMTRGVRERVQEVLEDWASLLPGDAAVIMISPDRSCPSGLRIWTLGVPRTELVDHEGQWLVVRALTKYEGDALRRERASVEEALEELAQIEEQVMKGGSRDS